MERSEEHNPLDKELFVKDTRGFVEAAVAVVALFIAMGAAAINLNGRVKANEESARYNTDIIIRIEESNKEVKSIQMDTLEKIEIGINQLNVTTARMDERLMRLEKRD